MLAACAAAAPAVLPGCGGCGGLLLAGDALHDEMRAEEPGLDPDPEDSPLDLPPDEPAAEDPPLEDLPPEGGDDGGAEPELPPPRYWAAACGIGGDELGWDIARAGAGSFVVAGTSAYLVPGGSVVWLLELDGAGHEARGLACGGEIGGRLRSITRTGDGGFAAAGWITTTGPHYNEMWVMKTGAGLGVEWLKAYGGRSDGYAEHISPTSDGGYIVAGFTTTVRWDLAVWKLDSSGALQWTAEHGGESDDFAMAADEMPGGDFLLAGGTYSFGAGSGDMWVLRLDGAGNVQWQKAYGSAGYDLANDMILTGDGGFLLAGETRSLAGGRAHAALVKADGGGNILWSRAYAGAGYETAFDAEEAPGGGFILAGDIADADGGVDVLVIRLDEEGHVMWQRGFGGEDDEWGRAVKPTADGGFIVAGYTRSYGADREDCWVIKMDAEGIVADSCPPGIGRETTLETPDLPFTSTETHAASQSTTGPGESIVFPPREVDASVEIVCGR